VFVRVAKPMVGDGKPFFHHGIAAISSAAINRRQVLKLAHASWLMKMPHF
jgi:hypothetical protein